MRLTYDIDTLTPYINWAYFYYAWQLKDEEQKAHIKREAEEFLASVKDKYYAHAVFLIVDAHADGDDIVIEENEVHLPFLRQQETESEYLCLADFVSREADQVGLFATSVDAGMETDFDHDPYEKMMAQLLADRLAEAAAERMHEEVRKHYWGYAKDEQLSIHEMQLEKFVGIRPAVGYPSLPDTSMNFLLNDLLNMQQIGITLTESGAMRPHASVSGLMISHPEAHYFNVGRIGVDQLEDYAQRRKMSITEMRKFLIANL
jgi:cobalamin-dependent methionine synthase I